MKYILALLILVPMSAQAETTQGTQGRRINKRTGETIYNYCRFDQNKIITNDCSGTMNATVNGHSGTLNCGSCVFTYSTGKSVNTIKGVKESSTGHAAPSTK